MWGARKGASMKKRMSDEAVVLLKHIQHGRENARTRMQLNIITGWSDRHIRQVIEEVREYFPILNLSDGHGYFRPRCNEVDLVKQYINQEKARVKSIQKSSTAAEKFIKEAAQDGE